MQGPSSITRADTIKRSLRVAVWVCALAAVVALVLEFGFWVPPLPVPLLVAIELVAVGVYVAARAYEIWTAADRWRAIRASWVDGLVVAGAGIFLVVWSEVSHHHVLKASAVYVAIMQGVLIARLAIEAVRLNLLLSQSHLHPTRIVVLTFVGLIVIGTLALSLPRAVRPEMIDGAGFSIPRHVLNCAFTATSAVCVTGLTVYDTGEDFTRFGQLVILLLIQAGGLGIMIFGSLFGLLAGRRLSLRQSLVLQDTLSYRTLGHMRSVVVFIIVTTFAAEATGVLMLLPMWQGADSSGSRWFYSVFHSISAFCNAGFSLQPDSLVRYRGAWQVYVCIAPLIVLGGLGFPVLHDLWQALRAAVRRRRARHAPSALSMPGHRRHRFSLHTKLVLITTAVLIIVPALLVMFLETFGPVSGGRVSSAASPATMAGDSVGGRLLDAFFYAVTCRTAGFNTVSVDIGSMSPAGHFVGIVLMFIGGSPASTAGGIKTISLAVLLLGVWTLLKGRENVEVMGRTIPERIVRRAAVLAVLMFAMMSLAALLLCYIERVTLLEALFETVSASGTVGLSTGLTPRLTLAGRIVIMVAMFAGRLGPLTVLIALAGQAKPSQYSYPEEEVGIG
jgi:trk system potassium uptake protein TrkH